MKMALGTRLASTAVLAIGLSGCGGGGDSASTNAGASGASPQSTILASTGSAAANPASVASAVVKLHPVLQRHINLFCTVRSQQTGLVYNEMGLKRTFFTNVRTAAFGRTQTFRRIKLRLVICPTNGGLMDNFALASSPPTNPEPMLSGYRISKKLIGYKMAV